MRLARYLGCSPLAYVLCVGQIRIINSLTGTHRRTLQFSASQSLPKRRKTELLAADPVNAIADLRMDRQRLTSRLETHTVASIGSLRAQVRRLDDAMALQTDDLSDLANNRSEVGGPLSNYAEIDEFEKLKAAIICRGQWRKG